MKGLKPPIRPRVGRQGVSEKNLVKGIPSKPNASVVAGQYQGLDERKVSNGELSKELIIAFESGIKRTTIVEENRGALNTLGNDEDADDSERQQTGAETHVEDPSWMDVRILWPELS